MRRNDAGFTTNYGFNVKNWRDLISKEDEEEYHGIDITIEEKRKTVKKDPTKFPPTKLKFIARAITELRSRQKRIMYRYDFKKFVDECFGDDIQDKVPTPDFHEEMYNAYQQSKRICVVCPRSHGKSSAARIYLLHQILNDECRQVLILGSSEGMASQNMRWIRDQLSDNTTLIDVYGSLKDSAKWSETEFLTNNGVKVVAKGAGQRVRGENDRGRPDLIYIDDLEDDEACSNRDNRHKLANWFTKAVMPIRSKNGRIIVTGTILDNDSLLKNIANNTYRDHIPWKVLWYQALNEDDKGNETALWPEMHPAEELKSIREVDPETFAQEYQNNPRSGSLAVFKKEWYTHYRQEDIYIQSNGVFFIDQPLNIEITCDLAISEKQGADYTVITSTGMCPNGNLYVLEIARFRTADPYDMIEEMFVMLEKWHGETLNIEAQIFQMAIVKQFEREMEKRKQYYAINEIKRPRDAAKLGRIKAIAPAVRLGKILWQHDMLELEDELNQVTATRLGKHDDILDTLSDAWVVQNEAVVEKREMEPDINTFAWAVKKGMLPTVGETRAKEKWTQRKTIRRHRKRI